MSLPRRTLQAWMAQCRRDAERGEGFAASDVLLLLDLLADADARAETAERNGSSLAADLRVELGHPVGIEKAKQIRNAAEAWGRERGFSLAEVHCGIDGDNQIFFFGVTRPAAGGEP